MTAPFLSLGVETSFVFDLPRKLDQLFEDKLTSMMVPLFHPRYRRDDNNISDQRTGPGTRSDMVVSSREWTSALIGKISPWIDLDSNSQKIRLSSEKVLKQEVAWASHLSVPAVLLPTPSLNCVNYSQVLNQLALNAQYLQFWVRIPLSFPTIPRNLDETMVDADNSNLPSEPPCVSEDLQSPEDPWEAWNQLRTVCEYNPKIGVALELTEDLPSAHVLDRWLGEPIKAVIIPLKIFLTNRKGYPTLSQRHQKFIVALIKLKVQIYFKGFPRHHGRTLPYAQYLMHLAQNASPNSEQERFESPYFDYLQAPLQPLMDNLESQTYETFEKDPIKYAQYERAIVDALLDVEATSDIVVMVVGAGRGPLVRAALRAAELAQRTIRLYAVEKNPNAVITLRNMKINEDWKNVTIVDSDMRKWDAPEKADIMVSELLGSFGDNELSPECLDGAQKFLKDDGVSIPCKYISYVAPISSSKLWNDVKNSQESLKALETAYVVRLHNFYELADAQPCFEFCHPNRSPRIDNRRYTKMEFVAKTSSTIHGFAGYFEAQLSGKHMISINPATFSTGMFSWFPLYIPLRTPMYVGEAQSIQVHFWRKESSTKVWYEWTAATNNQVFSPIHNPNGRSYWIGL